jgi:hypothetical protein
MNEEQDKRVERAIDSTFAILGRLESFVTVWILVLFSRWRLRWVFLYLRAIKRPYPRAVAYAVKWSFFFQLAYPDLSVEQSVKTFLFNQPDLRK